MQLKDKLKYVLTDEDGVSNVEVVVWISVVLIMIGFFIAYHDSIVEFLGRGFQRIDSKHSGSSYITGGRTGVRYQN